MRVSVKHFYKKKKNCRPESTAYDRLKASKQRYEVEHAIDEELNASRQRASKAIREEPIYEPRRSKLADMDGEFDEQVGRVSKIMYFKRQIHFCIVLIKFIIFCAFEISELFSSKLYTKKLSINLNFYRSNHH